MIHLIAQFGGYTALALLALALVCIALAERAPIREDLDGSEASPAAPRPEDAERPAIPRAIVVHLTVSDRIAKATPEEKEMYRRGLQKIRDREMIEKMIREVGGR